MSFKFFLVTSCILRLVFRIAVKPFESRCLDAFD